MHTQIHPPPRPMHPHIQHLTFFQNGVFIPALHKFSYHTLESTLSQSYLEPVQVTQFHYTIRNRGGDRFSSIQTPVATVKYSTTGMPEQEHASIIYGFDEITRALAALGKSHQDMPITTPHWFAEALCDGRQPLRANHIGIFISSTSRQFDTRQLLGAYR